MASQTDLTAALDGLRALGVSDFAFYNYGMLRAMNLAWLTAALSQEVQYV